MAAQSLLAKLGMRSATLGSAAALALAAPLAEGNPSMAAHTDATRMGWYFDRTGGAEKIGHVVMGVESLSVKSAGIAVPGTVAVGQTTAAYRVDVLVSGNDGIRVANGSNEVYLGTTAAQAAVGTLTASSFAIITSGGVSVSVGATGKATFVATSAVRASINLSPGVAPAAPDDGDVWVTTAAMFVRVNGVTQMLAAGGTIGGSVAVTQVAFGSGVNTIQGEAAFTYDSANNRVGLDGDVTFTAIATPSTPGSTDGRVYVENRAGRLEPTFLSPAEPAYNLQPGFRSTSIAYLVPGSGTGIENVGIPDSNTGTVSHPTLTNTDVRTWTSRFAITSAAVIGSSAGTRANKVMCWRGDAANRGGFTFFSRWASGSTDASQRVAVGLFASTSVLGNVNPSTQVNCVLVGYDTGDTNLQIMHNDGAGSCTKIDLGVNFPAVTNTTMYTITFYSAPNGSTIGYRVVNLGTGDVASGTLAADLPSNTTLLAPQMWINNDGSANAVAIESSIIYLEMTN